VLGELSAGTVSCKFPSFEAELGFWKYDVIFHIFPGGAAIVSKKLFFTAL